MATSTHSDILILGGGHNGLVCAAYLAAAGLSVRILERRDLVGGAAVTEEFHPGFRNSVASYTVSLLNPKVIRDLRLASHGLRIVERPYANFLPLPSGDHFKGGKHTEAELQRHCPGDIPRWHAYNARVDRIVAVLREIVHMTPPNIGDRIAFADWLSSASLARKLKHLNLGARRDLLDMFTKSAGELLDDYFQCEPLKAILGWDSVVGSFNSPYTPGCAYVLLHHLFGEVNGKAGQWGHAIGGMGAITEAMRKECVSRGVHVETGAAVARVLVRDGRAIGAETVDGSRFEASCVVSNIGPKPLYQSLIEPQHLSDEQHERMRRYRVGSGTFRMNVALSELPDFSAMPGTTLQPHHQTGILIGPSLAYFEQAFVDAKTREHNPGWSRAPIVELCISSALDDSLAPPGQHVASLFCQHVAREVTVGWDAHAQTVAELMIDTVDAYAPNFKRSVLGMDVLSPLELERRIGLAGGDIFHGTLGLDQMFSARPLLGQGNYRGALKGLYLCGAGTHPGGGVTGLPGRNAAREILKDLKRRPRPD